MVSNNKSCVKKTITFANLGLFFHFLSTVKCSSSVRTAVTDTVVIMVIVNDTINRDTLLC